MRLEVAFDQCEIRQLLRQSRVLQHLRDHRKVTAGTRQALREIFLLLVGKDLDEVTDARMIDDSFGKFEAAPLHG